MSKKEKQLELLNNSIEICIELVKDIKFDKSHKWHVNLVCLYLSILELSHSILILIQNDVSIGVPILLRSMMEAFIDFLNLINDREYGYYMDVAKLKEWSKIFLESKKGNNPYLKSISELKNLDKIIADNKSELADLEKKGYLPIPIFNKFEKVGLIAEYRSMYNFLCCYSHNNGRALIDRHIKIEKDGSDHQLHLFASISNIHYIDSCLGILVSSTEKIHTLLDTGKVDEINQLHTELTKMRNFLEPI